MECLIMTHGRDFEPMAEIFFCFLDDFGISGYVHVLAQCALFLPAQPSYSLGITDIYDNMMGTNSFSCKIVLDLTTYIL